MFDIDTTAVRAKSIALSEGSSELNRNAAEIGDVKSLLYGLSSMGPILSSLDTLITNVRLEAHYEEALYTAAQRIVRAFEDCEQEIMSYMDEDKFDIRVPVYGTPNFNLKSRTSDPRVDNKTLNELLELFN